MWPARPGSARDADDDAEPAPRPDDALEAQTGAVEQHGELGFGAFAPPVRTSRPTSSSLPHCGQLPACTTESTTNPRPSGVDASRHFVRMRTPSSCRRRRRVGQVFRVQVDGVELDPFGIVQLTASNALACTIGAL